MSEVAPGWYPDGHGALRYWDGAGWSNKTRPVGSEDAAPATQRIVPTGAAPFAVETPGATVVRTMDPVSFGSTAPTASTGSGRLALPRPTLLIAGGGAAIVLGTLLPWLKMMYFSISGVDTNLGAATAVAGVLLVLLGWALAVHRFTAPSSNQILGIVAAVLAVMSLGVVVYGSAQILDAASEMRAETSDSDDYGDYSDESDGETESLSMFVSAIDGPEPSMGSGLYLTGIGAAAAAAGGVMTVTRRRKR